jgi:hypothetical protein
VAKVRHVDSRSRLGRGAASATWASRPQPNMDVNRREPDGMACTGFLQSDVLGQRAMPGTIERIVELGEVTWR